MEDKQETQIQQKDAEPSSERKAKGEASYAAQMSDINQLTGHTLLLV